MKRLPSIRIGSFDTGPFDVDLGLLAESNMLIQANSGGGKSWALRRIAEQVFGKVPVIIIDPEGEFSTLRQKFDFVLVGKEGDTPADIRSAPLLAHKLLELGASAVCDLFELVPAQRRTWTAAFIQALVDAPKRLWRDVVVIVDEAHDFAPEKGHGDSVASDALVALASKGRKRGFLTIAATQRLGKLLKDFAAELKNVLIGQTWIDIDRDRARESLGIAKSEKIDFNKRIRNIEPGKFYALGRAFVKEPTIITVGDIITEHPTRGQRQSAPPPPTAKIKHLLPQLADLPQEAEKKIKTEAELRAEVAKLQRELAGAEAQQQAVIRRMVSEANGVLQLQKAVKKRVEVHVIPPGIQAAAKNAIIALDHSRHAAKALTEASDALATGINSAAKAITHIVNFKGPPIVWPVPQKLIPQPQKRAPLFPVKSQRSTNISADNNVMPAAARRLLAAALSRPNCTRSQLARLAGVKRTTSTFRNNFSWLNARGYIIASGDDVQPTDTGRAALPSANVPQSPGDLREMWRRKFSSAARRMFDAFFEQGPLSRDELALAANINRDTSTFRNNFSMLHAAGVLHRDGNSFDLAEELR